ncbi:amino acid permease [Galbitalea sp. SE-J8]|uniref:APC family permease n=1 Tax=Galbitalea sp. SE-J8 TaxID=3054952 RepID=UPI00259C72C3|nr:amino acid permease [Galbitalea sp. SE-J8]MDM4762485.1 amino acid permease [Galbitalea sp. SE-J8]
MSTTTRAGTRAAEPRAGGTLGLPSAAALYVAAVLGTGVLVLPGLAARAAGPASVVGVLGVLALSVPLAATFAALAARHPDAGGVATYVRLALGATAARSAGYLFFFGVAVGIPVVAVSGASYLVAVLGGASWAVVPVAAALLVPPFVSTAFGLRVSGRVQLVLTALLVAIVIGVVALAAPAVDPANFTPPLPRGWGGVGAAMSLFVWAFAGWEAVTHIAGEFRNPRRTIPAATAIALVVVGLAYLALQLVAVGVLGDAAGGSSVPLLDVLARSAPGAARWVIAVIAAIVTLGVLGAYLSAFAKLGASLARDGDLPRALAPGAESGGAPRRALAVVGVLTLVYGAALVASGLDLAPFILVHTSCMVVVYLLGAIAAVRILPRRTAGRAAAVVTVVLVAGLVGLAGLHLVIPLALVVVAVALTLIRRAAARRSATPRRSRRARTLRA